MQKREVYGFRKSKVAKGLCGVLLGTAFSVAVSGQPVLAAEDVEKVVETSESINADVVTTENPATNYKEAQGEPSKEAQTNQAQAGQTESALPVNVSTEALDTAVTQAKEAGVEVVQDATVEEAPKPEAELAKQKEEVKEDYRKQAESIQAETEAYKQKVATYEAEVAKVKAENKAREDAYAQQQKDHQAAVQAIEQANQAAQAEYERKVAEHNRQLEAIKQENQQKDADYAAALATYNTELARVRAANAQAKAEYDQKVAENNQRNEAIKQANEAAKQRNQEKKAQYDAALADYNTKLATYNQALAKYNADKKAYDDEQAAIKAALAEAQAHKSEDGNLSEPSAQSLVYDLEPNAELSLTTTGQFLKKSAVDEAFSHTAAYANKRFQLETLNVNYLEDADDVATSMELYGVMDDKAGWTSNVTSGVATSKWASVLLDKGQSATATYTNLQNSYYNGKKIAKIQYTYTIDPTSKYKNEKVWLGIFTDPTIGVFASAFTGTAEQDTSLFVKTAFTFYDEAGDPINFDNALLSVASLNREYNSVELAKDYSGTFVKISGSSVGEKNGMIYSTDTLNFKKGQGGSRFTMYPRGNEEGSGWDTADATNSWYGAGAIKMSGPNNHVTVGTISSTTLLQPAELPVVPGLNNSDAKAPNIWFSLNGKIRAVNVPKVTKENPTPPTAPTAPVEPTYEPADTPFEPVPTEPTYVGEPTPPTPVTPTPTPPTPVQPTPTGLPTPPTPPTFEQEPGKPATPTVHYRYRQLYSQPGVKKEIKNAEGADIDQKLVSKQSVVKFELKTDALTSGRTATTSFVLVDPLPTGYAFDLEATKAASAGFDVTYDTASHVVTFKATADTLALFNADLTKEVATLAPVVVGRVLNDGATYTNNFTLTVNDAYGVKSNIVRVTTPGKPNDPDNPGNNYIKPTKVNKNEQGLVIDGKEVLAGSTNFYELTWDLDQYKGDKSSPEAIKRGFHYVDDYPEEALTLRPELVRIVDADGNTVAGISVQQFDSFDAAPESVRMLLTKANISVKGAFQLFSAEDAEAFYNTYVVTGKTLTIIDPMVVKAEMGQTGGQYENQAYQIDFGNGYATEVVVNNVPKITPKKDVTISLDPATTENQDGQTIALNQVFNYRLIGGLVPANHSERLFDYRFVDDYDQTGDAYTGVYKVFTKVDVTLADETVIPAGTDVTEYTAVVADVENGVLTISFNATFLETVSLDSAFQSEVYIQMKRIKAGEFENTFVNTVNNVTYTSNTVRTVTPPPAPETPETPNTPRPPKPELPETGEADMTNVFGIAALNVLAGLGLVTSHKRRKHS